MKREYVIVLVLMLILGIAFIMVCIVWSSYRTASAAIDERRRERDMELEE